jgi:predicted DNA-binding transcriptional regulator YafY
VPRNAEVIRQWTILREIERARGAGVTIDELAALCSVTTRTIRRDLQALEESGFPLYDDKAHDDGRTRWRVNGQAFKGLSAGLTVSELCALYFSRTLLESLSGTRARSRNCPRR